jgi:predicted glutamine amidotransferase
MCRWLAYRGAPQRPAALVLDSPHSLVAQSRDSRLGAETVNGDGFGVGWYAAGGAPDRGPSLFRSIEPAWNDQNLREVTDAVTSPLFFSHVRAAAGPPIQQTNCHPFRFERWLFMHNGEIAGFDRLRRDLALAVDPSLYSHLQGTTDSEVLFHLALTAGLRDDPIHALEVAVGQV